MQRKFLVRGLGLVVFSLLVFGVVFDACDKYTHAGSVQVPSGDTVPKKLFLSDVMYIGEQHNAGLDFVLKKIVEARKEGFTGAFDKKFIMDAVLEFVGQDKDLKAQEGDLRSKKEALVSEVSDMLAMGTGAYLARTDALNATQKRYAVSLLRIETSDPMLFKEEVHHVIQSLQASVRSTQEQRPLFVMAAVALKSFAYWQKRGALWAATLLGKGMGSMDALKHPVKFSWTACFSDDAMGALIGARFVAFGLWAAPIGAAVLASGASFLREYR